MSGIKILHEDDTIIVAIKPGGLLAVPGRGPHKKDSMVSRLQQQFPDMPDQPAVHRLDMYTSGLMVFARTPDAHRHLSRQFMNRVVKKVYDAVIEGNVEQSSGLITLPFRLDINNRPLQIYDPIHGKTGITKWEKVASNQRGTHIRFFPLTGRTHQLRLHAAHPLGLGTPIIGDSLYGNGRDGDTMYLHASELSFDHPENGKHMHFLSSPPFSLPED